MKNLNDSQNPQSIKQPEDFLDRLAKGWVILIFFLLFVFTTGYFLPWFSKILEVPELGVVSIDLKFTYSPQWLYSMLGYYGEHGRQVYALSHLTSDVVFPLVYTFLFSLIIAYTFRRIFPLSSKIQKLKFSPFVLLGFDLLENFLLVILLLAYPQPLTALALMAGLVTAVKWLLAGSVVILASLGVLVWLVSRFGKNRNKD